MEKQKEKISLHQPESIQKRQFYKKYYAVSIEDRMIYKNPAALAKDLHIHHSNVWKAARGERNTAGGKHIEFLDKDKVDIFQYGRKNGFQLQWLKGKHIYDKEG